MHAMYFFRKPPGGPPAGARPRKRLVALAAAVVTGLGTVLAVAVATPAFAQPGTPPYWAQSPFSVPSGTGATVPFTEYEAEAASTTGTIIGPSFAQGSLPSEASGREAVQLTAQGQYVQFTLTSAANAFDLHYALNQGASGTLSVYVNGTKLSQQLSLTSAYSYISTGSITGSMTHKFYDDARMMFGQTYPAGTTVRFEVDSGNSAVPYTLDVADFYNVPAALTQPANTVSVTTYGADPTGVNDSTSAFNQAITAANSAGEAVWIPSGTFLVNSHLNIQAGTIEGAGDWYSQLKANELIDNTSAVSGPINLSGFAILGNTVGRHDDSTANAIDGSLGSGWTVNGLWIQDTNVGLWLQFGNSNCTVENSVIESTDADGVNFNGNASSCTVKNNFIRGTGDDSLAIWSYPTADSNITFANNTIVAPTLANGIADYGGSNNTISNNVVADDNALGSGIDVSNEEFLTPFTPLTGTINVTGNYLIRAGAYNPNWDHPMGAVQFDSYDSAFTGVTVNYSGGAILDSPYEAFEFVSGSGDGYAISGLSISNVNVQNVGTVVMQAETSGSASVSGVTASGVGVAGAYNDGYDSGTYTPGAFAFNLGSGNSGWSTTPVLTAFPAPVQAGALHPSTTSLSFGDVASGSTSSAQTVTITNPGTSAAPISSVSVTGPFSQTNTCGSSIAAGGSCTVSVKFAPTSGGALTGALTIATSAPGGPITVALAGTGVTSTTNLALGQPATASSSYETFVASNVTDGNTSSYWESTDGAGYPQTISVNLGSVQSIGSVTLDLPPSSAWNTRTETLSVLDSTNGTSYSQIVGSAGYTFNPSTGNTVTISLPSGTSAQYVELSFTGNTGWSAAQLSEFEVFPGGGGTGPTGSPLTASPTSLSFGSVTTGSTSAAQTVTVTNPGGIAASVSSVSVSGPFSQTNTCGGSIAAGASCTVSVKFAPTASGAASGTLSVASSAPSSPLTVALTGTGVSGAAALTASPTSVSFGSVAVGSTSSAQTVTVSNPGSSAASMSSIGVTGAFGESNNCGTSLAAGASCTVSVSFKPTAAGSATGTLSVNSSAPGSPLTVALSGTGTSSTTDLALNKPVTASSYTQVYAPTNAVDGNTSTYWEANNGVWPSTITVNLQSVQTLGSITIDLPPSSAWNTRTQTLSVLGSTNGSSFSTLVSSATYTWNPSTGNTVTIPLPAGTSDQYVEFSFTANSVQNGAQASEILIYG
jgi:Pectate lyase superfamily protein/F5/8 type C domain/Abnormal spindle-like microcephaly-assoc'd, ASPM-SPD-2-Hydin